MAIVSGVNSRRQKRGTPDRRLWIRGTSRREQSWFLQVDFEAEMASSHDGTCPRDLLQGLVAGTNPLVRANLYSS